MSEFWAILWIIIKYGLIIGLSFSIVVALIVVFHPICISLKGRGSIKGQRGEAKLSYLFGLLRLRYVASSHTQDVWLEFGRFKKLLQRVSVRDNEAIENTDNKQDVIESVKEEELKEKSLEDYKETAETAETKIKVDNINESPKEEVVEKDSVQEETIDSSSENKLSTEEVSKETQDALSDNNHSPDDDSLLKEDTKESEELLKSKEEVKETLSDEDFKVEATSEQLAELQSILEEEEKKKEQQEELKQKKSKSGFNAKLLKFKKDFNHRYKQIKSNLVLLKQKWNSLWPVVKRFWNRGKKGFRFHEAYLKVEYSLDEHYLTGMLCGYLAPTVSFAKRYGLDFVPVPVFPNIPEAGVYSKASWQIDILPYKLIWAVTALLFEKNIYKELYWLYKWKKAKKSKPKTER